MSYWHWTNQSGHYSDLTNFIISLILLRLYFQCMLFLNVYCLVVSKYTLGKTLHTLVCFLIFIGIVSYFFFTFSILIWIMFLMCFLVYHGLFGWYILYIVIPPSRIHFKKELPEGCLLVVNGNFNFLAVCENIIKAKCECHLLPCCHSGSIKFLWMTWSWDIIFSKWNWENLLVVYPVRTFPSMAFLCLIHKFPSLKRTHRTN